MVQGMAQVLDFSVPLSRFRVVAATVATAAGDDDPPWVSRRAGRR
jgi:hypothetical protein